MVNARWRTNPFTGVVNSLLITEEEHTIEFHPEVNAYGFYADEGIELDPGIPVILVEDNTAQTAFTEIPKTIAPNAGQYRVDYDAEGYFNTGFVNCNSGDVGKNILFTYYGTGTIVHPTFRLQTDFNLPGNLNVEGTSNFEGDVTLASLTGATISASNKKVEDVATPTASADAVPLGYLNGRLPFRHYVELTASGTWTRPDGVDFVFVECIGGGGGGGGSASGNQAGGAGASGEYKRGLVAVTTDIGYTIGAGGGAAVAAGNGSDGADTIFSTVTAHGGKGGLSFSSGYYGGAANGYESSPGENGLVVAGAVLRGGNGGGDGGGLGAYDAGATDAGDGVANTGGGGGGGANARAAGDGGSGVVRLWY